MSKYHSIIFSTLIILTLLFVPLTKFGATKASLAATITVDGTVTDSGAPVKDVKIGIGSPTDWQETLTNSIGYYSITIQTNGELWMHVRPDFSSRLSQINMHRGDATSNITQDFSLEDGYLLSVLPVSNGGTPIISEVSTDVLPLENTLPGNQWYFLDKNDSTGYYEGVFPPDIYNVTVNNLPEGYYKTTQAFDLRTIDLSANLPVNTNYVHPIPYDPPDAGKISFGSPDGLGEAVVTGAPGAVLPLAQVLLVNLNSFHQSHTISNMDGSFSSNIFAPPGSSIMVKHGPASHRWNDLDVGLSEGINPFPGTIINLPHTHTTAPGRIPFAAAGAIDYSVDDPNTTENYVGSAWAIEGSSGPVVVDGEWTRQLDGNYQGSLISGLYSGGLNWTHPSIGDLDNDNDLDLIVGERSGHLFLYRNHGTSSNPDWKFETNDFNGITSDWWIYPNLADITNDNLPDLIIGYGDGKVDIFINSISGYSSSPDMTLLAGENAAPALDDLDNDGDLDLLIGVYDIEGSGNGVIYHYENSGTSASPEWILHSTTYGGISEPNEGLQPAFIDLDGDNDNDLLVGLQGQIIWYERGGTSSNPIWTRHNIDPIGYGGGSSATSIGVGDWNGDGKKDIVTGEHWGNLRFFSNALPSSWIEHVFEFPFELLGDTAPAFTDWDNDGDVDLLIGQAHGNIYQYTNTGNNMTPNWRDDGVLMQLPWTNHPHPFPTFADIDLDGDDDLFIGEGDWDSLDGGGNIRFYENIGSPEVPNWVLNSSNYIGIDVGGWSTPIFEDIDADGDYDLFIGDAEGTLTFIENIGTATNPSWDVPISNYVGLDFGDFSAPSFFDVDQDGDLDMLVGSENGSLSYCKNTGTSNSPSWELISLVYPGIDVGDHSTPVSVDINGDSNPELIIGDGDGGINLYNYIGPGSTSLNGNKYTPGDFIKFDGKLSIFSQVIIPSTDVESIVVEGEVGMLMLFNNDGEAIPAQNYFMSNMLTPTGFPIQRTGRPIDWFGHRFEVTNLHYVSGHILEGDISIEVNLPVDLLEGIYRPILALEFTGIPGGTEWLAANVTQFTLTTNEAALPPIMVGAVDSPKLIWRLMMDDFVQGTRGAGAIEDAGQFELASQIVSQGAPFYVPPIDERTGQPITYRLEPFLPMISFTDRRMPTPPLLPFNLPGGELCVTVEGPDNQVNNLGCENFDQSFNRTKTTRGGHDLNIGTVQMDDVYSLQTASGNFRHNFDQYGHHVITMTGEVTDLWGNTYPGGGTYDLWIANPLDIDPGILPGTPLAIGDSINPAIHINPRVPAEISFTITHFPNSDPAQVQVYEMNGVANQFGYFRSSGQAITLNQPGEYRVDLLATYQDPSGVLYMGSLTWPGVVMTPNNIADLIAHGRRGLDSLESIPSDWFISCELPIPADAVSHTFNPYHNGDLVWSRMVDGDECEPGETSGGDSLILGASVHDPGSVIESVVRSRATSNNIETSQPGTLDERINAGETPLFSSSLSGRPVQMVPEGEIDQIAYSYRSSQRPGVRVREVVAEDSQSGGYWRLDTLYDDQLGVGVLGDQPNDFKFQYSGVVYRDIDSGKKEYLGHGSGWVFIPDSDTSGSRVMPPFSGPGNGGWDTRGGPILTLKGEDIHIFILPTGVRPGSILQVGDTFHFAGHIMPTLDSKVDITVTSPSGEEHSITGQANSIGYFYQPGENFVVNEPGLWSVDVNIWHDGLCSGGQVVSPYPSGDVLGSDNGRYWFYVAPTLSPRLNVFTPSPGFLSFNNEVTPITIAGSLPADLSEVNIHYTISMPGFILKQGKVQPSKGSYSFNFDPVQLKNDFPNLDLISRDDWQAGLADTFTISLFLKGKSGSNSVYRANTITIQGEQVFVGNSLFAQSNQIHLPLINK